MDCQTNTIDLQKEPLELYKTNKELYLFKNLQTQKYLYDRKLLQLAYFSKYQGNVQRTKSLKIVHLKQDSNQILPALQDWKRICNHKLKLYDPQNDIYSRLVSMSGLIHSIEYDIENRNNGLGLKKCDRITAVVDDEAKIHALCVSSDDPFNVTAWKINSLVSSPINLRDGNQHHIEGAATALIQDVIEQAIRKQKLAPESPTEIEVGKVAVTVNALRDSIAFYEHIGFVEYRDSINNMILKDHMLVKFLNKYGGRCTYG